METGLYPVCAGICITDIFHLIGKAAIQSTSVLPIAEEMRVNGWRFNNTVLSSQMSVLETSTQ